MRTVSVTWLLITILGVSAYARVALREGMASEGQPMKSQEASSAAQEPKPEQPKHQPRPEQPKPEQPEPAKQTPKSKPPKAEKQESTPKQQEKAEKEQQKKEKKNESKGQKEPASKSARIPDRDFKAHFGQAHKVKAQQLITTRTIVPNQTRFVFSGYTFIFLDPWPTDWLLTDDCYIDDIDGEYFLFDEFHPGIRVALSVVF